MAQNKKILACFSGNDPTGGAGIQADIESCRAHNVHCLPLITVNTVQDSAAITNTLATPAEFLLEQFESLNRDMHISGIKVGMLANEEQIQALCHLIKQVQLPLIIDPVFSSGFGSAEKQDPYLESFCQYLAPLATVISPNIIEARRMAKQFNQQGNDNINKRIEQLGKTLLKHSARHVLITGGHIDEEMDAADKTEDVHLKLKHYYFYQADKQASEISCKIFTNPRLPHHYHGSGCTLASSIAANIVNGLIIHDAIDKALNYTFSSLQGAQSLGRHQYFPQR